MIVFSNGNKGGVGKSLVSDLVLDYFTLKGHNDIFLVEADRANQESVHANMKFLGKERYKLIDLEKINSSGDAVGIFNFFDFLYELHTKNHNVKVVVDLPATVSKTFQANSDFFKECFQALQTPVITLWTVNCEEFGVLSLREYIKFFPDSKICVIKNKFFGDTFAFDMIQSDESKKIHFQDGFVSVFLPKCESFIMSEYRKSRVCFSELLELLKFSHRIKFSQWLSSSRKVMEDIFNSFSVSL